MESAAALPLVLPFPPRAATMERVSAVEVSDGELIERTGTGDRAAFEQL